MKYQMQSNFAKQIEEFTAEKRALGYQYDGGVARLADFDRFCVGNFPAETELTKDLCMAWAKPRATEGNRNLGVRLGPLREFARYLNSYGEAAFVLPKRLAGKWVKSMPYIFSEEEIQIFWGVLDNLTNNCKFPLRHMQLPIAFRLMYCCGLRPCEVHRLGANDVDLTIGKIHIKESKGHKDRIVMMADEMTELCKRYDAQIRECIPKRKPFFPKSDGSYYTGAWLHYDFVTLWKQTGLQTRNNETPRNYDFRHSFATHRLYHWMREGKDLSVMIPYLSEYMGHTRLSHTHYYIHLVPGMLESMSGIDYHRFEELLPEVEADD